MFQTRFCILPYLFASAVALPVASDLTDSQNSPTAMPFTRFCYNCKELSTEDGRKKCEESVPLYLDGAVSAPFHKSCEQPSSARCLSAVQDFWARSCPGKRNHEQFCELCKDATEENYASCKIGGKGYCSYMNQNVSFCDTCDDKGEDSLECRQLVLPFRNETCAYTRAPTSIAAFVADAIPKTPTDMHPYFVGGAVMSGVALFAMAAFVCYKCRKDDAQSDTIYITYGPLDGGAAQHAV